MSEREIAAGWIGRRISRLRRGRGWTLAVLAARVDLSTTQLSRIESAVRQPSLGTLIELSRAFGVTLSELVDDEPATTYHLTRRAERTPRQIAGAEITPLSGHFPGLEALHLTLPPHSSAPEARHTGEEWLYILSGAVDVAVHTDTFPLGPGDALHFPAAIPHSVHNTGGDTAELLVVYTRTPRRE